MPTYRYVLMLLCIAAFLPAHASAATTAQNRSAAVQRQVVHLHKLEWKSQSVLNFWRHKAHWALRTRHDKCWDKAPSPAWERTCYKARRSLAFHAERLKWLQTKLEKLTAPVLDTGIEANWLCIHSHEAAWDNPGVDWRGNPSPYYGGLQMDLQFQRTYGPEFLARYGTANHWPVEVQMAVAERARRSGRGYWPWPSTAKACGLI